MFIQTEATPNPQTLKFIPGQAVIDQGNLEYLSGDQASQSPLASRLFGIDGVQAVFLGTDFISVTKGTMEWQQLKPAVLGAIMEHYMSGDPVVTSDAAPQSDDDGEFFDPKDIETVETIKELLETRVRPAVAQDGGDIVFKGFRDGIVYLTMRGACAGCPSSTVTLQHGIENLLRHFLPEVQAVRPAEDY